MEYTVDEVSPDADAKLDRNFERWLSGKQILFENSEAEALYRDRVTLIRDAIRMETPPQRVPICPSAGYFPFEYAGISFHDVMYDVDAMADALETYYNDFSPDSYSRPFIGSGRVLDLLDSKQYRWPGHGISYDQEFQYVEDEYMKPEEYDALISDPSGFQLSTYLPRVCGALEPLRKIPALVNLRSLPSMLGGTFPFSLPDVRKTLATLMEAGEESVRWIDGIQEVSNKINSRGIPSLAGGMTSAPFDIIGDCLRGTRGVLLDMMRKPEKLLQACEKFVPIAVKQGAMAASLGGSPIVFMALHKGAHSFMSKAQFQKFYWPTLRKVIMGLVNEGLVPLLFAEAEYESRLDIISDLPKGKTVWWFEKMDMARAKATIGQISCIAGNIPNYLFRTGSPEDVKQYCKTLIDEAGKNGGYILSTAAGLQGAKPENVKAMFEFSKNYGIYRSY